MSKFSLYRLMSIIFLIVHFSFLKSVFATESDVGFQFNDPVASYNGQNISRQQFLDFIQESTRLAEKDFSEASTELMQEYVNSYVIYQELSEKIKQDPIYSSQQVQEALEILSNYALAGLYEELEGTLEGEFEAVKDDVKVDESLSIASLLLISQKEGRPQSETGIKDSPDLRNMLESAYQNVLVKAHLGDKHDLKVQDIYQKRYDWAVKSYLSDLYIENYLESIFDQQEIDIMFEQWLSEQAFFEYKGAHIYVLKEEEAQNILDQLKEQKITFEEAVTLYSQDPASNTYEGKLGRGGWVSFPQEEHPFSRAIISMDEGDISEEVVKGVAGYHIIRLDEKRKSEGPSYINDASFKEEMWQDHRTTELLEQMGEFLEIKVY